MAKKTKTSKKIKKQAALEKREEAMVEGIIEGSPDAIGVVVIRLDCGCRKMAALTIDGEPASKIIMYRDLAESICDKCKEDNGDYTRITKQFIYWKNPELAEDKKKDIAFKVMGTTNYSGIAH